MSNAKSSTGAAAADERVESCRASLRGERGTDANYLIDVLLQRPEVREEAWQKLEEIGLPERALRRLVRSADRLGNEELVTRCWEALFEFYPHDENLAWIVCYHQPRRDEAWKRLVERKAEAKWWNSLLLTMFLHVRTKEFREVIWPEIVLAQFDEDDLLYLMDRDVSEAPRIGRYLRERGCSEDAERVIVELIALNDKLEAMGIPD